MPVIHINVKNKVATCSLRDPLVVCNNTDYTVKFTFDSEWDGVTSKIARFIWNGKYSDVNIVDNECVMPIVNNTTECTVGVYGGDISTSTPAKIPCRLSVLCGFPAESADMWLRKLIDGTLTEVTPEMLHGVTEIGQYMFAYQTNLEKVEIPASVAILNNGAFSYCSGLKSVTLPSVISFDEENTWELFYDAPIEQLTAPANMLRWFANTSHLKTLVINGGETIDGYTFNNCQALTSVTIGDGITSIGSSSFNNCNNLLSIKIGKDVESIASNVFTGCASLTSIEVDAGNTHYHAANGCLIETATKTIVACTNTATIPSDGSVTVIGSGAFKNHTDLTTIPEGITTIKGSAFSGCTGLTSIPASVTSIGSGAFSGCTGLTSITIQAGITRIESSTFANCTSLTSVSLAEGSQLTTILASAFAGCTGLTSIDFLDGVTSINTSAFKNCTSLTSIAIPSSVTTIQTGVFTGCNNVETITVDEANTKYHSAGNCVIDTAAKTLLVGCKNSLIPSDGSVTIIGAYTFQGFTSLTSIDIPTNITAINSYAFASSGLTSIETPFHTTINQSAFQSCKNLSSAKILGNNNIAGSHAFNDCTALTSVVFSSQPKITNYCFGGCNAVTKYDFRGAWSNTPTLPSITSLGHAAGCKIIVPDSRYDTWKAATNWKALTGVVWVKASEYTEE